ncbi:MAG TPA: sodium:calcium antiporter, partial [Pseudomonas sp.]|nr:sodium:calcium antiporter [Pseudomonas sp.]
YYLAYTLHLAMFSSGLPVIELFHHAMSRYVLPLTAITLAVIFLRAWKHQR